MTATGTSRAAPALLTLLLGAALALASPLAAQAQAGAAESAAAQSVQSEPLAQKPKTQKSAKKSTQKSGKKPAKKSTRKKANNSKSAKTTKTAAAGTVRLSPRVRIEALGPAGIAPVPFQDVRAFLTRSQIASSDTLAAAPRVVALPENRALVTVGDTVYARGGELLSAAPGRVFQLYRQAEPLKDPVSGEVLGQEIRAVGEAELLRHGQEAPPGAAPGAGEIPHTLRIVHASDAIQIGDRLAALPAQPLTGVSLKSFIPHRPSAAQSGVVVAVPDRAEAGANQLVVVNRGQREGVRLGDVYSVQSRDRVTTDPTSPGQVGMTVPGASKATLMLVHVFEKSSYALVMDSTWSVRVGDAIVPPADAAATR